MPQRSQEAERKDFGRPLQSPLVILFGIHLGVELLSHMVTLFSWAASFIYSSKEERPVSDVPLHSWFPREKPPLLSLSAFLGSWAPSCRAIFPELLWKGIKLTTDRIFTVTKPVF